MVSSRASRGHKPNPSWEVLETTIYPTLFHILLISRRGARAIMGNAHRPPNLYAPKRDDCNPPSKGSLTEGGGDRGLPAPA